VRICAFDLDHTLVSSPLDLAAMALDMRALVERVNGPLPDRPDRYRVGEIIEHCRTHVPAFEPELWACALDHERRAVTQARLEPGAIEALQGTRAAGYKVALWTNNAREVTTLVLERFGLLPHFDLVVTRDDMRALKPDADGWRVISGTLGPATAAVVVGDSWVDGLAAAAAGVPFVAYRARAAELERWKVTPAAHLDDLRRLPAWLAVGDRRR
jgi:phosphoglycolate phosphatase